MLGQKIMQIRKSKGWTRGDLSRATRLSIGYIAAIERGAVHPSLKTLVIIAEKLGVSVEDFLDLK